jgi:hypothetical protein
MILRPFGAFTNNGELRREAPKGRNISTMGAAPKVQAHRIYESLFRALTGRNTLIKLLGNKPSRPFGFGIVGDFSLLNYNIRGIN